MSHKDQAAKITRAEKTATRSSTSPAKLEDQAYLSSSTEAKQTFQQTRVDPQALHPHDLLRLQRSVGNRAVQRLLANRILQAKLTVGAAHDPYEEEADVVAEQVMRMPTDPALPESEGNVQRTVEEEELQAKPLSDTLTPLVPRTAQEDEELQTKRASAADSFETGEDFENRLNATRGGGAPLPDTMRDFMEPRFDADFSGVRLHADSESAQLNREVSAQAFTLGQDIYLGEGQSDITSTAGKQLLAHELTHVVQQTGTAIHAAPAPYTDRTARAMPHIQMMSIKGEHIYPTGKNGKALLEKARLAMFTAGLSPHGMGKIFKEVAQEDKNWNSAEAFTSHFVGLAKQEVERVETARALGEKKVKGWTRRLKIGRPGWPESYKKVVKKGEDIRHIVRNATLKNAIEAERKFQAEQRGEPQAAQVMQTIAAAMHLPDKCVHSLEWTMAIYKAAYLNLGNLFPGAGAINRVIGLTADKISNIGLKLITSQEFAAPDVIEETFEEVAYLVSEVSDQMERQAEKMDSQQATVFLAGFEEFYDDLTDYLIDREEEFVKASLRQAQLEQGELKEMSEESDFDIGVTKAQIGREFIDIGANFGFDIPNEALESTPMQELIKTEIMLANYVPGKPEELAEVLKRFMALKHIMQI